MPSLPFTASVWTLDIFARVYAAYKVIKESRPLQFATAGAILLIMAVLIVTREPTDPNAAHRIDFDPYDVLGVSPNATISQINRAYRQLAVRMHPDKLDASTPEEEELQRSLFVLVQRSAEILRDQEKRKNYDEYGNPDGPPEEYWWEESYPDWIMNPGKKFILFYVLLVGVLISVPFCAIFLVPALETPMDSIVSHVNSKVDHAEKLLLEDDFDTAEKVLQEVQQVWDSLLVKFPLWSESMQSMLIDFRVVCRMSQLLLAKDADSGEQTRQTQQQVVKLISDFRDKYIKTPAFGSREASASMLPYATDVKKTVQSVNMPPAAQKSIIKSLASICKKVL